MRILYFGDIVGDDTLKIFEDYLEDIKKEYKINLVLANAENLTGGKGLSFKHYKALKKLGFAGLSMGNHTFSKREIRDYMDDATIVKPANLNSEEGKDILYIKYNDKTIAMVNLLGRVYSNTPLDCPFKTMDALLDEIEADYILVDFHGDATSEKKAFFYDFAGKVTAIVGTHTHVQTADEEVYKNTCYITDMGMCGPEKSIIGDDVDMIIKRFRTGVFEPLVVSSDKNYILNGVILDINDNGNSITRFQKKFVLND